MMTRIHKALIRAARNTASLQCASINAAGDFLRTYFEPQEHSLEYVICGGHTLKVKKTKRDTVPR